MVATHQEPFFVTAQMGKDAVDHMTDPQRVALALYATNLVKCEHCIMSLHRLTNLARETAFEISANRMVDGARHG